jgi:imidazole glycerol-phosphate synthase subunit HisF
VPAFRILPCLDVHAGRVVKGVRFVELRDMGEPAVLARRYRDEGADELVFLDISATVEEREALRRVVNAVAEVLDIPFTVGGGVRDDQDAAALLAAGADKISVNSAAVTDPTLLTRLAHRFGSQCVVLAIDARRQGIGDSGQGTERREAGTGYRVPGTDLPTPPEPGETGVCNGSRFPDPGSLPRWEVVTHGGRRPTGLDAVAWAAGAARRGAGELLVTSMDRDGTGEGFDVELLEAIREVSDLPLIASGGGELPEHFVAAAAVGADAGLAATIFHAGRTSVGALKEALAAAGVTVRRDA